jgi:DNA invertase Pin-like site-specific DNA recombinase
MNPMAYSYVRFSSSRQRHGSSLHRQTQDTVAGESPESWCSRNNVILDTSLTFRDLGRSAWQGQKQKELYAFLEAVQTGRILPGSYLLVEKLDRVSRKGVDEGMEVIKKILNAGISIVTLMNGRIYGPKSHKKLKDGLMELQFYLEAAEEYSETLSKRVSAAWEVMRGKARQRILVSARIPAWLKPVGQGSERRAVVIPEKAAIVRHVFDLALAGHGTIVIRRLLSEDKLDNGRRNPHKRPPLSGPDWTRKAVWDLLRDRSVLGEYQPKSGGKNSGEPIEDYFPAIISLAPFHKVGALLGSRHNNNVARQSVKMLNLFSGILKDARSGANYILVERVEKDRGQGKYHHYVYGSESTQGANSFPLEVFDKAILKELREIDPRELLPANGGQDEVLELAGELSGLEAEISAIAADMDVEYSDTLVAVLRRKEAKKKAVAARLAEARLRASTPLTEVWGELQPIIDVLASAADPAAIRLRLRGVLRRVIDNIQLLVVPRGKRRLAEVQVNFKDGPRRDYLIVHRAATGNIPGKHPARWHVHSLRIEQPRTFGPGDQLDMFDIGDLRDPAMRDYRLRHLEEMSVAVIDRLLEAGQDA